jgi:hypothetical protein
LADVVDRRGTGAFSGTYSWSYYRNQYSTLFDAAFVRQLNETAWVPDVSGELQRPEFVAFDSLGWKDNPFLTSKIHFKPPIIEALAKEAGIEAGVLDLLKKHGITSEAQLRTMLGIVDGDLAGTADGVPPHSAVAETPKENPSVSHEPESSPAPEPGTSSKTSSDDGTTETRAGGSNKAGGMGAKYGAPRETQHGARSRPFISYVGTHPDDEEPDPDGLDQAAREALEAKAIDRILEYEPNLKRTPTHNRGFDLFESGPDGRPVRFIEVKAMTTDMQRRPVGLSRTQFEFAQEHGEAYWLYVVEHAGDNEFRIVRVQDPAGRARTFTFDRGWLAVSDIEATKQG